MVQPYMIRNMAYESKQVYVEMKSKNINMESSQNLNKIAIFYLLAIKNIQR